MLEDDDEFMRRWDTRQTLGEINGFLTAFAHLNSTQVGYEFRSCDFALQSINRLADVETSVREWLRPIYRANQRSIKVLTLQELGAPLETIYETLSRWLFMHVQPHNDGWRTDLITPLASRIYEFQNWSAVYSVQIKPQSVSRMMDTGDILVFDCDHNPYSRRAFALTFFQWTTD